MKRGIESAYPKADRPVRRARSGRLRRRRRGRRRRPPPPANRPPAFTSPATANAPENGSGTIYTATATDPGRQSADLLAVGRRRPRRLLDHRRRRPLLRPAARFRGADRRRRATMSISSSSRSATARPARRSTSPSPSPMSAPTPSASRRVGTGFAAAALSDRRSGRLGPGLRRPAGRADPHPQSRHRRDRGDALPRRHRPDRDRRRARPARLRAGARFQRDRHLLRLPDRPGRPASRSAATAPWPAIATRPIRRPPTSSSTIAHPPTTIMAAGSISGPTASSMPAIGDGGGGGDPANNAPEHQRPARQDAADRSAQRRLPGRSAARLCDSRRQPVRRRRRPARNLGLWPAQSRSATSFDPLTQNLWIGDVGQDAREEIDLMRPTDGGANFGWRIMEGTAVFNGTPIPAWSPPVAEYSHGSGPREGNSVTGGYVYRGPVEALRGQLFLRRFHHRQSLVDPDRARSPSARPCRAASSPCAAPISRPMRARSTMSRSFGVDQAGNLYIVDFDGEIFRVEPARVERVPAKAGPVRLSRRWAPAFAGDRAAPPSRPRRSPAAPPGSASDAGRRAPRYRGGRCGSCRRARSGPSRRCWRRGCPGCRRSTASEPGSFLMTTHEPRGAAVGLVAPGEIDPVGVDAVGEARRSRSYGPRSPRLRGAGRRCGRPGSGGSIRRAGRRRRASGP